MISMAGNTGRCSAKTLQLDNVVITSYIDASLLPTKAKGGFGLITPFVGA